MNEQIGNKINDKTYIKLTPFKGFVLENFPFIEADFDAITNYQLLCKVIEYLNNVISNQNTVQELGTDLVNAYNSLVDAVNLAINEFETDVTADINQFKVDINNDFDEFTSNITTQFNNLKNYVDNYFDNNFPELVSDKLDEMAENGTLENLLNDTAHLIKVYNTYNEMIDDASTFTNGLKLKTLGYYSVNDGGGAEYYVGNVVLSNKYQVTLNSGLYLNLIIKNNILNIKQIGAKGNNTDDDSTIIQNAINLALANNYELLIDGNTYLVNTGLIINNTINLKIEGELHTTQNITILTITSNNSNININKLRGTNDQGTGLKLLGRNAYNSINIIEISDLAYGIVFDNQTGGGINYNRTIFNYLDNTYDIYYICDGNAWINQNQFYGGRLSGDYGVYFEKGSNQSNDYDGNNFYDIGFEELYDAITLNFANKNTFQNFRMMEGIRNKYIVLASDCRSNVFESILTSECTYDKIVDNNNTYAKCNMYKMRVSNANYTLSSEDMKIYNGLPIINKFSGDNANQGDKFWLDVDGTFYTSTNPFSKVNIFMCDLSGSTKNINLILDDRYNLVNESYNEFYLQVTQRAGVNNVIIKTSDNTELFNLATYGASSGEYTGLYYFKHVSNAGSSYKWLIYKLQ